MPQSAPIPHDHDTLDRITRILERYLVEQETSPNLVANIEDINFAVSPSWLAPIFTSKQIHEEDFRVLGHFKNPNALTLDIGAQFGHSVCSMRSAGCETGILSFEPQLWMRPCLSEIARLDGYRHDYRIMALGAANGVLDFVTPVLNGVAITGLTSANPSLEGFAENLYIHQRTYMADTPFSSLTFYRFSSPVSTLDAALKSEAPFLIPTDTIAAIKIDTENLEADVLFGAQETLRRHRPLIMIEGGNRLHAVRDILHELGYLSALRDADRLVLSDAPSHGPNGFFVHSDRVDEYETAGIITR
ncbi:MAG: FkbM family methyltransferase [Alphaproteobacteria bacterium]|nr:FkbM family methyltransferase [Alphaproteobacteria bacterium]